MVTLAMADMLDSSTSEELRYAQAAQDASPAAMEFGILVPDPLNVPLMGTPVDPPPFPAPATGPASSTQGSYSQEEASWPKGLGSNNWAIGPSRTADGRAILASDPHLMYALPGTWYRVMLTWPDHMVVGISVPGIPGVVMGSNGTVAWGFTNTTGDFADMIIIETDPDDPERYLVPGGSEPFEHVTETIQVQGGAAIELDLRLTRWGVVGHGGDGEPEMVEHWTLLHPDAGMFAILELPMARTVEAALDIGASWHGPSQNMVAVDDAGSIGWTVTGLIPVRQGFNGRTPVSWADGTRRWTGFVGRDKRPRVVNPPAGGVWTANNRTVEGEDRDLLGWSFAAGARAGRIAHVLQETTSATEKDMLALQLDTRLEVFDFYRDLMLARLKTMEQTPRRTQAIDVLRGWNGTADADQLAVKMLASMRSGLSTLIKDRVLVPPGTGLFAGRGIPLSEGALRRFVIEQPRNLVPRPFATWEQALDSEVDRAIEVKLMDDFDHLTTPWGQQNMATFEHPIAQMMPFGADALRLPETPQSGHSWAVRVAHPQFGASARLVVSPGHEDEGILHLPGGQSGHPMSPHFTDGHDDWLHGRPSPLLPGDEVARVQLVPRGP
jgi:penicillin amidase